VHTTAVSLHALLIYCNINADDDMQLSMSIFLVSEMPTCAVIRNPSVFHINANYYIIFSNGVEVERGVYAFESRLVSLRLNHTSTCAKLLITETTHTLLPVDIDS